MWFRILVLSLGAFAIGTDSFVIAGILPDIAQGFHIPLALAGLAVTVFALVYALGAPVLATAAGTIERRRLLLISLTVLGIANLLSALSPNFALLLVARALAAAGAALYTPTASAVAASLAPAEQRGRALSLVTTGLTASTILGVPLGVLISSWFHWQATLVFVAMLCALAFIGIFTLFAPLPPTSRISLHTRFAFLKRRRFLIALSHTLLFMTGAQIVTTYLRPLLQQITHLNEVTVSAMLFLFGISGLIGGLSGGYSSDRWGSLRTILVGLFLLSAALFVIPWTFITLSGTVLTLLIWGITGWALIPAQQHRLIAFAPEQASIILSLNGSAVYLGISCGSALGSILVQSTSLNVLCWVGSAWEVVTLVLIIINTITERRSVGNILPMKA